LIIAGAKRSYWMYVSKEGSFAEMQDSIVPYYISFFIFGIGIFVSLSLVAMPIFKALLQKIKS
jgi:nitric oxide reductase subunit B